jgi:ABC-type glutathione transport system ATPase component
MWVNGLEEEPEVFSKYVAGYPLYFLLGSIAFYWILVALCELKVFDIEKCLSGKGKSNQVSAQDPDILEEEARVAGKTSEELKVRVKDLQKTYGKVTAVQRVSFGLEYGECFALLGISGAGKTTCFKSMTGEIYPSAGSVHIHGQDVTTASGFAIARK